MTAFDYAVIAIAALSVLLGVVRGGVREVMSLISWIGSIALAFHFAGHVAPLLPASISNPWLRYLVAFIGLVVVGLLLFALLTLLLSKLLQRAALGPWDRAVGLLFGLVRALVIVLALVLLAGLTPLPREPAWRNALLSPMLVAVAKNVRPLLPSMLSTRIRYD